MKGLQRLVAHPKASCSFASFSPDNSLLLTGCETVKLWSFGSNQQRKLVHEFKDHSGYVNHGEFSPDGSKFATCSNDKTALVYSLKSGQLVQRLEHHNFGVSCCTFSPDSALLCTCSWDNSVALCSGDVISLLLGHRNPVTSAAFDGHGYLATSSWDKSVRVWSLERGTSCPMTGHKDVVWSVAFSPTNPHLLASVSRDATTMLWDARMAGRVGVLEDCTVNLKCVRYSPDGSKLVSVGDDSTIVIRDPANMSKVLKNTGGHRGSINHVSFTSDSRYLATSGEDGAVGIWDTASQDTVDDLSNLLGYSNLLGQGDMM